MRYSKLGRSNLAVRWIRHPGSRNQVVLAIKVYNNMADADIPNKERAPEAYAW